MNKVIMKKNGQLNINGVDIQAVYGFTIKMKGDDPATIAVQFDATDIDVEVGVSDFQEGKPLFENGDGTNDNTKYGR